RERVPLDRQGAGEVQVMWVVPVRDGGQEHGLIGQGFGRSTADLRRDAKVAVDRKVRAVILERRHRDERDAVLGRGTADLRPGQALVQQWSRPHASRSPPGRVRAGRRHRTRRGVPLCRRRKEARLDLSKPSPWVARLAVLGVVAVAWAALWLSRPAVHTARHRTTTPPGLGTAPIATGARSFCPAWAYGAYALTGTFVPPNYPGLPPSESPVRCFPSPREAVRAGFRPAETPPGDLVVDGVYLVPTSVSLGATCARAAVGLGYAVPCPGMLPNPPPFGSRPHCA